MRIKLNGKVGSVCEQAQHDQTNIVIFTLACNLTM